MSDAEALFLVDHDQTEALEVDALGQDRMGADHYVDRARRQRVARSFRFGRGDQAREAADLDREAFEPRTEVVVMLARQQRRRADDRHLMPRHRRHERGAQRNLGLPEADVADDQPVHRLARRQIVEHIADRAVLIVGFLIGKTVDEAGITGGIGLDHLAGAQRALGGNRDQIAGDLADALLHAALAPLPRFAAQPVERRAVLRPSRSGSGPRDFSTGT